MRLKPRLNANPIIVKELRSRMRGARAFAILTGMLVLLGLASYGLFRVVTLTSGYGGTPLSPMIGQVVFAGLALLELVAICFITPALTTGAISSEKEMLTYEMLMATPLNPTSILRGKLVSALSYIFLLIFAAVPMASLVFTFGGVSPRDMFKAVVLLLVVAVTLGIIGIAMSALLRRTGRATVLTYLLVLVMFFGTTVAYGFWAALRQQAPPRWLLVANPASALFSAMTPAQNGIDVSSFLGSLGAILGGNLGSVLGTNPGSTGFPRPLYHYTLVLYGGVALILYLLATRLVRPVRRWRLTWQEIAGGLALCLLFGGAVALAFGLTSKRYEQASVFAPQPTAMPMPMIAKAFPGNVMAQSGVAVDVPAPTEAPAPTPTPEPTPTPVPPPGGPVLHPTFPPSGPDAFADDDRAAVYAAVVRQLYTVDHTFGDRPPNWPVVYILAVTNDNMTDLTTDKPESQPIPPAIQAAVTDALADLPAEIRWVADAKDVPLEQPGDRVAGGGVRMMLGNIVPQDDGSVQVTASLYFANLGAGGRTYVLREVDGAWSVVGTTGMEWIS